MVRFVRIARRADVSALVLEEREGEVGGVQLSMYLGYSGGGEGPKGRNVTEQAGQGFGVGRGGKGEREERSSGEDCRKTRKTLRWPTYKATRRGARPRHARTAAHVSPLPILLFAVKESSILRPE